MGESNGAGTENQVEDGDVTKDTHESGLEEESENHAAVNHTLLGDGQVTGLANEEIGPLHAHNGNQVASLGVAESFGGVADLLVRDSGVAVEVESGVFVSGPTAAAPGVNSTLSVEKTEVNLVVSGTVPVELSSEVREALVGVTVVLVVGVVDISLSGDISVLKSHEECGLGAHSIIVQDVEVGEETSGGLHHTDLKVSEGDELHVD
jgi:hypothetical protein